MAQQLAIGDKEVRIEAGDDVLVLNTLSAANLDPRSPWFGRVNANDAGAFGHSFGGAVAAQVCYQDPRVKAALNEDGWTFGDVATQGLDKPYMLMDDDIRGYSGAIEFDGCTNSPRIRIGSADMDNFDKTMHRFGGYYVLILGSKHFNFSDRSLYSPIRRMDGLGTVSPKLAHQAIEAYTLQFFSHYLLHKPAPLLAANHSPYKEVQFENWFAHNASTPLRAPI